MTTVKILASGGRYVSHFCAPLHIGLFVILQVQGAHSYTFPQKKSRHIYVVRICNTVDASHTLVESNDSKVKDL